MVTPQTKAENVAIGDRLRRTRSALCALDSKLPTTLRHWADLLEIDEDNLSNWERGISRAADTYVQKLKKRFGVTFDWVYGADASRLPRDLYQAIFSGPSATLPAKEPAQRSKVRARR